MKIGYILITPKGLEALAKSIKIIAGEGKMARLEVHQTEDSHGEIKLCCTPEAGWIDLMKGFDE